MLFYWLHFFFDADAMLIRYDIFADFATACALMLPPSHADVYAPDAAFHDADCRHYAAAHVISLMPRRDAYATLPLSYATIHAMLLTLRCFDTILRAVTLPLLFLRC